MHSNTFSQANTNTLFIASLTLCVLVLSGCETVTIDTDTEQALIEVETTPALTTSPLKNVSTNDILFAQVALKQLNYNIGRIDGIWGPRSQQAIQQFEKIRNIQSANGNLSKANLYAMRKASKLKKNDLSRFATTLPASEGIADKLDKQVALEGAPQLILLDKPYPMMEKANPFSEMIAVLQAGAGIYVISLENGWYEIESLNEQRGYIKEP